MKYLVAIALLLVLLPTAALCEGEYSFGVEGA